MAVALTFSLAVVASSAQGRELGAALFDGHCVSTAVIKNGDSHPLVGGTRVRLKFAHEAQRDVARWSVGCNDFGASVDIKPRRLEIGVIDHTLVECSELTMRQEAWVARFLGSDPKWHRTGGKLRLWRGDDEIKLRRRT